MLTNTIELYTLLYVLPIIHQTMHMYYTQDFTILLSEVDLSSE